MALGDAYIDVHANTDPFIRDLQQLKASEALKGSDKDFEDHGRILAGSLSRGFADGLDKDRNTIKKSLVSRLADSFTGAGEDLMKLFAGGLSSPGSIALIASAGLAFAEVLIAAIGAGIAVAGGVGVIGFAAFLLKEEPAIKDAANRLGKTAGSVFRESAKGLLDPLVGTLNYLDSKLKSLQPQFTAIFNAAAPIIDKLTVGLVGLVTNLLPGFQKMLEDSGPIFDMLSRSLPKIGEALGHVFEAIGNNAPQIATLTEHLLDLVTWLLNLFGTLFDFITFVFGGEASRTVRKFFTDLLPSALNSSITALKNWAASLPGIVLGAVANFGNLLWNAGASLIGGLINGIASRVQLLKDWMRYLSNLIASYLPGSPAKVGALSGQGYSMIRGQHMVEDLAKGMKMEMDSVKLSAGGLASIVTGDTHITFNGAVTEAAGRSAGSAAGRSILDMIVSNQSRLAVRVV